MAIRQGPSVIHRAIIILVFSYLIALWMVRFIATHLAIARDTSCGNTEFEKRCCTANLGKSNAVP